MIISKQQSDSGPPKPPTPHDYEYTPELSIPVDVGTGISWKDKDGHECETRIGSYEMESGKRKASLNETSFVGGISFGAMHYYASIEVMGPGIYDKTEGKNYACGGYGPERPDEYLHRICLRAQRKVIAGERDMAGRTLGRPGQLTERFNTPEEAKKAAIALFHKRFAPGWCLVNDNSEVIEQT